MAVSLGWLTAWLSPLPRGVTLLASNQIEPLEVIGREVIPAIASL